MLRHWVFTVLEEATDKDGVPSEVWRSVLRAAKLIEEAEGYHFRTDEAATLFDDIQLARKVQDISNIIHEIAIRYGFKYGSLFLLKSGSFGSTWKHRVCTSLPEHWLRDYKNRNFQFVDPVILKSLMSTQPDFVSRAEDDSPVVQQFWDAATQHGIGPTAYCGKHNLKSGAIIGFSFTSENKETACKHKIRLDASDIYKLTEVLCEVFEEISAVGGIKSGDLSREEVYFLKMIVSGHSLSAPISYDGFKVCPKGVQASIFRKLGVENIFQAVSIATARGWFDDISYSEGEVHTIFEEVPNTEPHKTYGSKK